MEAKALEAERGVDKSSTKDDALKKAIASSELYMKASQLANSKHDKTRLRDKCMQLLTRAESIKKSAQWTPELETPILLDSPISKRVLTRREELILLEGSKLHGLVFPPWKSGPTSSVFEKQSNGDLYADSAELILSDAQKEIFAGWRRPGEILSIMASRDVIAGPCHEGDFMLASEEIDLVQDVTTDCSVVASLCASIARTSEGYGTLVSAIIRPYDTIKRQPQISENGKYVVCLNFNGCVRAVTIDDRLPTSRNSRNLYVTDRKNPKLMWPALIEKAYLKVRGGYDFPGSNSGTDLWVITGWIPEQIFLQSDDLQRERLWQRVYKAFGFGDVMITLGTGKLSRKDEKELGLVGEHDFAVLNMKKDGSRRLLLIKNPWREAPAEKEYHSLTVGTDLPVAPFTQMLLESLPSELAKLAGPGTFWMNFDDVIQYFESLYLNWNPKLFTHRQDHHFSWAPLSNSSPGSLINNPQYMVRASDGTLWILLSRHFADGEQEIMQAASASGLLAVKSSALGYISIYAFDTDGRKVHITDDALYRGPFVDSPQTLARLELSSASVYTIAVVQQGLPLPRYSFSLSFFSRSPLQVEPAVDKYDHYSTRSGVWTPRTAGGNLNAVTYPINPQFSITVPQTTDMTFLIETDDVDLPVHVKVVWGGGERVTAVRSRDVLGTSGEYRRGCAFANITNVAPGKYTIVCSTFEAGQLGRFNLRVGAMVSCSLGPVLAEAAGRLSHRLPMLTFQSGNSRMLALVAVSRLTKMKAIARYTHRTPQASHSLSRPLLRISFELGQGPNKVTLNASGDGVFDDALMGIRTLEIDVDASANQRGGIWVVVERLGGPTGRDNVDVEILSEHPVTTGAWEAGDDP